MYINVVLFWVTKGTVLFDTLYVLLINGHLYISMAAATAAFNDSISPDIGINTLLLAAFTAESVKPFPSLPMSMA